TILPWHIAVLSSIPRQRPGKATRRAFFLFQSAWFLYVMEQFILNYSLHQTSTDYQTLPAHIEQYESLYGTLPEAVVADAGYGSDENYGLLADKGIEAYIKYNTFDKEQKEGIKAFSNDSLHYNEQENCLYCPMGQRMQHIGDGQRITTSGHLQ